MGITGHRKRKKKNYKFLGIQLASEQVKVTFKFCVRVISELFFQYQHFEHYRRDYFSYFKCVMISIFSIVRIDVLHLISVHLNAQVSCQLTLFLFHIRAAHRHVWRTGVLQTPGKGKLGRCRFSSLYYIFSFSFTWISVVRFSPFAWNNLRASVTSQIILFIGLRT